MDYLPTLKLTSSCSDPPGTRLAVNLLSATRTPTLQHISDRINLISAQHNLGTPPKNVANLMMYAFEVR